MWCRNFFLDLWISVESFPLQSIMPVKFPSTPQNRSNDVPILKTQKKKKKENTLQIDL